MTSTTLKRTSNITYTPHLLHSFKNVEVRSDYAHFSTNANVLAGACPYVISPLREQLMIGGDAVLILCGFSESLVETLNEFIHTGSMSLLEGQQKELESDFKFLQVPVPSSFWEDPVIIPRVKVEIKEEYDKDVVLKDMGADFEESLLFNDVEDNDDGGESDALEIDTENGDETIEDPEPSGTFSAEGLIIRRKDVKRGVGQFMFQCWICPLQFYRPHLLKKHVAKRHRKSLHFLEGPFKCENCDIEFKTIGVYARHIQIPSVTCKRESMCDACGRKCKNGMELYNHKRTHHLKDDPQPCDVCGQMFPNKYKMRVHKSYHHNDKQCEHCSQTFKGNSSLKQHIQTVHVDNHKKPFICNFCGKGFGRHQAFKEHLDIHNQIKRHKCRICEYRCTSSSNRNKHERQAHNFVRSAVKSKPDNDLP